MSPHPSITTPPRLHLPRQTYNPDDPYGLSSLYAELSSLYPDLYSSYSIDESYYSSLLADYSSILASYSIPSYSFPQYTASATAAGRITAGDSNPTSAAVSGSNGNGSSGGLSTGAKIGIGVGVPLAVFFLAAIGIFLWCMGKRKGKKTSTTIVASAHPDIPPQQQPQAQQQQPQMGYANNQGYMPGYQQQNISPPPQYMQPQQPGIAGAYGGYAKGPGPNVIEMEQEYHFARPGVVEMGDGVPEPPPQQQQQQRKKKK